MLFTKIDLSHAYNQIKHREFHYQLYSLGFVPGILAIWGSISPCSISSTAARIRDDILVTEKLKQSI